MMGSETITSVVREALLAIIAFAVIRVFMIFVLQTLLARLELPRILSECLLGLALVAYVLIRLSAVGVNLAGVVTTSAVLSAALAFSAQETLGNLWAGISLQLENTVRLGDWIRIDSTVGQVVSIRWRSMAIATYTNETIVVPNSLLMKNKVEVIARRADERIPWRAERDVRGRLRPAARARLRGGLRGAQAGRDPERPAHAAPGVPLQGLRRRAARSTRVVYQVIDPRLDWNTKSEVLAHVYSALARADMPIPFPRRVVELREDTRSDRQRRELIDKRAILDEIELFTSLTSEERDALARKLDAALYATDDIVCRQGEPADSLFILARGQVHIVGEAPPGVTRPRFATLQAPAYFGEMGLLLGAPRGATVLASGRRPLLLPRQARLRRDPQGAAGTRGRAVRGAGGAAGGEPGDAAGVRQRAARQASRQRRRRDGAEDPRLLRPGGWRRGRDEVNAAGRRISARRRDPRA